VRMPKKADPLPKDQVALIRKWVEQGALCDAEDPTALLASIVPRAPHPKPPENYPRPIPITAAAFRPDGKDLAVGGYHEITFWNPEDGTLARRIGDVAERTHGLAYNKDGSLLAVASGTPGQLGEIRLVDPIAGKLIRRLATTSDAAFDVAFSPDGSKLAACSADRAVRIFTVASGEETLVIEDHADWVLGVAWSPDGKLIATASRDKTSKVFDAESGESQITYAGHTGPVFSVGWKADGKQLFTGGADKKIHFWNPTDGKKTAEISGFGGTIFALRAEGDQLFSCSADKTVRLHAVEKRNQIRSLAGHADWVYSLSYCPSTKRIASGGHDGEIRVWNAEDGKELAKFFAAPGYVPQKQPK
ncbi:MAG: WD40 repeat domain-containing protein, partial [Planctomycetales bacterium]